MNAISRAGSEQRLPSPPRRIHKPPLTPPNEDSPAGSSAAGAREEPASARGSVPDPPGFNDGRFGKYVFYFVWIGAVPFALAIGSVWLLTPPPGALNPSWLRSNVGEQQIPAGIILFTAIAMTLWRFRHDLPLADKIGLGGRKDIPRRCARASEDAGTLLDEARRILRANRRDVERELTSSEREQLKQALDALERAMLAEKFDPAEFDAAHAKADRTVGEHLPAGAKARCASTPSRSASPSPSRSSSAPSSSRPSRSPADR